MAGNLEYMNDRHLDVFFVNAEFAAKGYQELSKDNSAVEPTTWSLLLAQSCRAKGVVSICLQRKLVGDLADCYGIRKVLCCKK